MNVLFLSHCREVMLELCSKVLTESSVRSLSTIQHNTVTATTYVIYWLNTCCQQHQSKYTNTLNTKTWLSSCIYASTCISVPKQSVCVLTPHLLAVSVVCRSVWFVELLGCRWPPGGSTCTAGGHRRQGSPLSPLGWRYPEGWGFPCPHLHLRAAPSPWELQEEHPAQCVKLGDNRGTCFSAEQSSYKDNGTQVKRERHDYMNWSLFLPKTTVFPWQQETH